MIDDHSAGLPLAVRADQLAVLATALNLHQGTSHQLGLDDAEPTTGKSSKVPHTTIPGFAQHPRLAWWRLW